MNRDSLRDTSTHLSENLNPPGTAEKPLIEPSEMKKHLHVALHGVGGDWDITIHAFFGEPPQQIEVTHTKHASNRSVRATATDHGTYTVLHIAHRTDGSERINVIAEDLLLGDALTAMADAANAQLKAAQPTRLHYAFHRLTRFKF